MYVDPKDCSLIKAGHEHNLLWYDDEGPVQKHNKQKGFWATCEHCDYKGFLTLEEIHGDFE